MPSPTLTILTAVILFVCTFIRSAVGFGDALLAMPLLAMVVGLKVASPIVSFAGFFVSLIILLFDRHVIDAKSTWRLIVATIAGVPFGLWLLNHVPEHLVKWVLGITLIAYGSINLLSPKYPHLRHERYAFPFGFVAGILAGAYNTNGPPIAIYGILRRWSPDDFRATLQCYFLFSGIATIVGHGLAGLWSPMVWYLSLWALPGIGFGIYLGGKANRLIPQPMFSQIIFGLLIVVGCLFLV
ncbi:sulfite exporter TauE/SafE family protein [Cyanobacteria bacterium FACHB-63]|nr:sulfite exporter TauE/SafE family protein [Cyanobacteria bacterium FACHB-63]